MKVLHTLLAQTGNGPVEGFKGSVEDFLHFNHPGVPLERLALVYASDEERAALEAAGITFENDCSLCSFTSYGQHPSIECCTAGCARLGYSNR